MVGKTVFKLAPGAYERTAVDERLANGPGPGRRRCGPRARAALWALALAAVLALAALTAARELEAAALRREVAALAADLLLLRAQHRALQQQIERQDILKKIQMLENTIYVDLDEESSESAAAVGDSLEKMDELTVEDDTDDADDYDGAEDAAGDYYMDYDTRKREEAKQNLVRLRPEDWIEGTAHDPERPVGSALGERPLGTGAAAGGVGVRARRSPAGADPTAPRAHFNTNDRNMKKSDAKPAEVGEEAEARRRPPAARTPRNTPEEGGRRPFVAAHFHGNTSHLTLGVDEHYHGNGLVRVPHEETHSVWWPAAWTAAAPRPRPTLAGRGRVLVHRSGVYLVYVQVYYFDAHDTVGWVLHRTNVEREGRDALLQCTRTSPSVERVEKPNTCFSAAALLLRAGDRLAVRNTGGDRHAIMYPEKSFVGLVQLADADDPDAVEL